MEELKLNFLAKTCLCPGINTIISFLLTSSQPAYDTNKYRSDCDDWIHEYLYGMQNEIYRVPLKPENYSGYFFITIAN